MAGDAPSPEAKDECGRVLHFGVQLPVLEEPVGVEAFGVGVDTRVPRHRPEQVDYRSAADHKAGQETYQRLARMSEPFGIR